MPSEVAWNMATADNVKLDKTGLANAIDDIVKPGAGPERRPRQFLALFFSTSVAISLQCGDCRRFAL